MRVLLPLVEFAETADIETSSDEYAQRFSGEIGSWFLKVQEEATLQMVAQYPGARVLDVGGGHGQVTHALVQNGYQLTVLGSAEVCNRRIHDFIDNNHCSFRVGNILDLPYSNKSFDIVLSYQLLPHVGHWKMFVAELSRVAQKAVILDYPAIHSINCSAPFLFRFKKHLEGNTRPFTLFKESELLEVFKTAGFSRSGRYSQFFLPMVLHRALNFSRLSSATETILRLMGLTPLFGSPVILKMVRVRG